MAQPEELVFDPGDNASCYFMEPVGIREVRDVRAGLRVRKANRRAFLNVIVNAGTFEDDRITDMEFPPLQDPIDVEARYPGAKFTTGVCLRIPDFFFPVE